MGKNKKKKLINPVKNLDDFEDPNSQINKNNYELDQIGRMKRKKYDQAHYEPDGELIEYTAVISKGADIFSKASKYAPHIMTGFGALGTILQARKKRKIGDAEKRLHDREMNVRDNDMIRARRGEADKQNKLIDKYEKKYTSQQQKNTRRNIIRGLKGGNIQDEFSAPTNSVGGGKIAGTVEAGDDPPVKKKRKKGEPTIIARGCMPGARSRFKGGVQLLASLKKNKYT